MFFEEVTGHRVSDHYAKKHLHKSLSKNSCSVDLVDIKSTLLKHYTSGTSIFRKT